MAVFDDKKYAVIYLNDKGFIKSVPLEYSEDGGGEWTATFVVPEKYLIIGVIWNGFPVNYPMNPPVDIFTPDWSDLTSIERHLMTSSNANFVVPTDQYRTENIPVTWAQK